MGAGAKIIGAVCIGSDVKIGANAVVVTDLPDGATAVGIPARIARIYGEPLTPQSLTAVNRERLRSGASRAPQRRRNASLKSKLRIGN